MKDITRREMIKVGAASVATLATMDARTFASSIEDESDPKGKKTPLLHISDLYHPPQDPDDHIDLATAIALDEFDIRGVVLDVTQKFLEGAPTGFDIPRDPGFVVVAQLAYLTGRAFPVAVGPAHPLRDTLDTAKDQESTGQSGVSLLLKVLEESSTPMVISVVGSARVLAAAFNRNPDLVRSKTRAVLLNAGSLGGTKQEWNVGLDLAAYTRIWQADLPLHWYPCATERGAFDASHERGTYWKATHADLFRNLSAPMKAWISYAFAGNGRGDIIRCLQEEGKGSVWEGILAGQRNLWSTASLVMAAGRVLAHTENGWRFVPRDAAANLDVWEFRLDPVKGDINDAGAVSWQQAEKDSRAKLFGRRPGAAYATAMTEALNSLLQTI